LRGEGQPSLITAQPSTIALRSRNPAHDCVSRITNVRTCGRQRPATIMKLKVQRENAGLCGSCRHAILAGTKSGKLRIACDWFDQNILEPIAACSKHSDRSRPSLSDMRSTAWILQTDDR